MSKQTVLKLSKNLGLSCKNVLYQLQIKSPSCSMRGAHITVCEQGDKVTVLYKGRAVDCKTLGTTAKEIEAFKRVLPTSRPSKDYTWNNYL